MKNGERNGIFLYMLLVVVPSSCLLGLFLFCLWCGDIFKQKKKNRKMRVIRDGANPYSDKFACVVFDLFFLFVVVGDIKKKI